MTFSWPHIHARCHIERVPSLKGLGEIYALSPGIALLGFHVHSGRGLAANRDSRVYAETYETLRKSSKTIRTSMESSCSSSLWAKISTIRSGSRQNWN